MTPPPLIRLVRVCRAYGDPAPADAAGQPVRALDDLSLEIAEKDFVAVTGPSGCGKSTLLHLLGGLDQPTSGELFVGDLALHSADDRALTRYRRHDLGIVFQFFNLLPTMNVLENVCLPRLLAGESPARIRPRALELLELVGLAHRTNHFVHQLSGGELQRTAIARALVHRPRLLLADEPTGNLDSQGAARVVEVFSRVAAAGLTTLLIVTHSEEVARAASRRIRLRDGRLESGGA
ncbi:MAG: ABC transporter ATP-binding protein [Verrucomicrobia bacterium]|nr:ABC transporter ATP-binding protein [Verrucomicrobiota bacterium]MBV9657964.1 ABC transporter ATP-binding protein [Verrucomicrobiota bacterium]